MLDQQHMLLVALGCVCLYLLVEIRNTVNKTLNNSVKFHNIIEDRWNDTGHHIMPDQTIMADKDHNVTVDRPIPKTKN